MLIESTNISKSFLSPFWPSFYEKSFSKHIFLLAFLKAGFLAALKRQSLYNFQAGYQTQQRTKGISFRLQLFNRISTEKILPDEMKIPERRNRKILENLVKTALSILTHTKFRSSDSVYQTILKVAEKFPNWDQKQTTKSLDILRRQFAFSKRLIENIQEFFSQLREPGQRIPHYLNEGRIRIIKLITVDKTFFLLLSKVLRSEVEIFASSELLY